ncbi:hypothetical protein LIER_29090 [Lithospermum erythrorhizon]|uniref:Uncharacterized protein n=1 Tax=Lithospermum erythrorhizon TaxID=34254 RepID=A0AAV3RLM1_LITER
MGKGLFVFQMETEEAKQGALERCHWSFSQHHLILMSNTSEQKRLGYTRVCVEVRVESNMFDEIPEKYVNGDQGCIAIQMLVPMESAKGKEALEESDAPGSSGTLKFGAIDIEQVNLLPIPAGSVSSKVKETRPDTPVNRGVNDVPTLQLSPIGEDVIEEEEGGSKSTDLETNILQKVSSVTAQMAVEPAQQIRGGSVILEKNKKKGRRSSRLAAPPPNPV